MAQINDQPTQRPPKLVATIEDYREKWGHAVALPSPPLSVRKLQARIDDLEKQQGTTGNPLQDIKIQSDLNRYRGQLAARIPVIP